MCRILFTLFIVIFIIKDIVFAQETVSSYRFYSIADGLADNNINDIVKDDYGFVWIAGQNGLTRFDGNNFIIYNSSNTNEFFPGNNITKLYTSGRKIYLLSRQEGLIELDPLSQRFKRISERGMVAMYKKNDITAYLYSDDFLEVKKGKLDAVKKLLKYKYKDDIAIHENKIYISSYHNGFYELDITFLNQERVFSAANKTGYFLYHSKKFGVVFNLSDQLLVLDQNNKLVKHPEVELGNIVTSFSEYSDGSSQLIYNFKRVNLKDSLSFYNFLQKEIPNVELKKVLKINETTYLFASNQGLIKINYNFQKYIKSIDDNDFFESKALRVRRKYLRAREENSICWASQPSLNTIRN